MSLYYANSQDTICALASASGRAGLSVIRVSGGKALQAVRCLCPSLPADVLPRYSYYLELLDPTGAELVDRVVLVLFEEGRSFTGDLSIEISCHGSPVIVESILQLLIQSGCRMAHPGEFSYRAFMNGKIDLAQAEAIHTLVQSQSKVASKVALAQLGGDLSRRIERLEAGLLWCLAQIEASIDFSEEDLEVTSATELISRCEKMKADLSVLLRSYQKGRGLQQGFQVVLAGRPNVGKSSLLNLIAVEERSIVTSTEGTTRDTIDHVAHIDGARVVFTDTAGLRESNDEVERQGVERSRRKIEQADLVLFIYDVAKGWTSADEELLAQVKEWSGGSSLWRIGNKVDQCKGSVSPRPEEVFVSALNEADREVIFEQVRSVLKPGEYEDLVVSQARHYELLERAEKALGETLEALSRGDSWEFPAVGLHEALQSLRSLRGQDVDEKVIDQVFKEFCLGK